MSNLIYLTYISIILVFGIISSIISRKLNGIFHHGSKDLINHEELIKLIISLLKIKECNFKYVFTTNENRHLSLLSKKNKFPNHLNFDYESILSEIT